MIEQKNNDHQVSLPQEDLDLALELLKRLNRLTFANGHRVSEYVTVDGFEPWWFQQENIYWYILVPYTRYRELINQIIAQNESVVITDAPAQFSALVKLLLEADSTVPVSFAGTRAGRRRDGLKGRLTLWSIWVIKLVVTATSLLAFRLNKPPVLLYAIDKISPGLRHDFRLHSIYNKLNSDKLSFSEYLHSIDDATALRNLWVRRRPVVFFETVASLLYRWQHRKSTQREHLRKVPFDRDVPDSAFLAAVARLGLEMSVRSASQVQCLKWMVRWQRPCSAVILDDSRHANELIAACKELGIFTLGYQHGLFNRYHPGLMAYGFGSARKHTFDAYGLWSDYFLQRLLGSSELYDERNAFVCGPIRPPSAEEINQSQAARQPGSPIRVLIVSEPRARLSEVKCYAQVLASDARFRITVKLRPGEDISKARIDWGDTTGQMQFLTTGTVFEAFRDADVVLGTYSTVLYEAALALKPALIVNTSFTYGHDLAKDGLAFWAENPHSVCDIAVRAFQTPIVELLSRRDRLWGKLEQDSMNRLFASILASDPSSARQ
ncbi:MAG: hypothetical protein HZB31_14580 [Nitrospirae bacterium]|nr:hypothetical protein [Nitrospirota bacterium]